MFRLALVQMLVEGGEPTKNRLRAKERIKEAVEKKAKVILLPEAFNLGWTHPSARTKAELIPEGETCRTLSRLAIKHKVYICGGIIEKTPDGVYNSAVLIDPKGAVIIHHRKLNELEIAHNLYEQGNRLCTVKTQLCTFGVMICADAFARGHIVSRTLGLMGADVILSPCAWAVPADYDNEKQPYEKFWLGHYQPVARDYRVWMVGVSNVGELKAGPWAGRKCIGCSIAVAPDGSLVAKAPYGESADTIMYIDIEPVPRPARGDGWEKVWGNP